VQGAPADLVAIDLRQPAAIGVPPLEAAAFVSSPQWVDRVWVAGELVVEGGRHPSRDVIVADARSAIEKVLALQ
jgi:cytosine/adenosine deaminase-related metal-dependent hydrolase